MTLQVKHEARNPKPETSPNLEARIAAARRRSQIVSMEILSDLPFFVLGSDFEFRIWMTA
jgi:hypothetical protein